MFHIINMTSVYEDLVWELKNKLKNKLITFDDLFTLINDEDYNFIQDETIRPLIDQIVAEREKIGRNMERKLNNLLWLNETLIKFGEEPQTSITQARKILKTISINIYDLESEQYEKKTTRELLRKELQKNKHRRFPLYSAKENRNLKLFLIKI